MEPVKSPHDHPKKQESVKRVPWNPIVGILFIVLVFYGAQVISALIIGAYIELTGGKSSDAIGLIASGSAVLQFSFISISAIVTLASIYFFMKRYSFSFKDIGLTKPRRKDIAVGVLAVVPYYLVFIITVAVATVLFPELDTDQKQELGFDFIKGSTALLMTFVALVIIQPFIEEVAVRGFLYSSIKRLLPLILAAIGTSLIFAAAHLGASSSGLLYIAGIDTFVLSLFLIYLREKTGSLWPCITLHAIKNGVAFMALFIFKVG